MIEKKQWIPYGKKARYIAIGVKDMNKQTLESFELEKNKDRDNFKVIKKIKEKYEFDLNPITLEERKEKSWLDKDAEW